MSARKQKNKSSLISGNLFVKGRRTSVRMEACFWQEFNALTVVAREELVATAAARGSGSFTSWRNFEQWKSWRAGPKLRIFPVCLRSTLDTLFVAAWRDVSRSSIPLGVGVFSLWPSKRTCLSHDLNSAQHFALYTVEILKSWSQVIIDCLCQHGFQ